MYQFGSYLDCFVNYSVMRKPLLIFSFISTLFATVINVPNDYGTIQEGINMSLEEDTVLISSGTYHENLILEKSITLASHFILDGDISYRDNTIINGSYATEGDRFGSCLAIGTGIGVGRDRDIITPTIVGLTFTEGKGTTMERLIISDGDTTEINWKSGGGLLIQSSSPIIEWNRFKNNGNDNRIEEGGAITITDEDIDQLRRSPNRETREDTLILRNNIFENNYSDIGKSVINREPGIDIDMSSSTFDVYSSDYQAVSNYWCKSDSGSFDFSNGCF